MTIIASNRPGRFNLLYGLELVAEDAAGAAKNRVFGLAVNPGGYTVSEQFASKVEFTAGGVHVSESGILVRDVTVRGTFGVSLKRGWAAGTEDKPGGGTKMISRDGNGLFDEFRSFLRIYAKLKSRASTGIKWRLVWHDFIRGDHWLIVPETLDTNRDAASARLSNPYEFTFKAVAESALSSRGALRDGLDKILGGIDSAINAVNDTIGYVDDAANLLNTANADIVARGNAAIASVNYLISSASGLLSGVESFLTLDRAFAGSVAGVVGAWTELTDQAARTWSPGSASANDSLALHDAASSIGDSVDALRSNDAVWGRGSTERLGRRRDLIESRARPGDAAVGSGLASPRTPGSDARADGEAARAAREPAPGSYSGRRAYLIRPGDTVYGIAAREAGGPDRAPEIIEINDLRAPYITAAGLPGTLAPGDTLWLPLSGGGTTGTVGESDDPERDLLGVDVALDDGGEIRVLPDGSDVEIVRGVDAYVQSLRYVVFGAPLGRNLVYPHVGMAAPIGEGNRGNREREMSLAARTAALSDSRTSSVERVDAVDVGDAIEIEVWVVPRGSDSSRVVRGRV